MYVDIFQAEEASTSEPSFTSGIENLSENELRQRRLDGSQFFETRDHHEAEIIVNPQVETMSSSNDLFWSILIATLLFAIILLVLRRLFLV